jgi:adenylate kinase family enzyme
LSNVVIFGNSGSGKSTLAKKMSAKHTLAHLDLDTIAWQATSPPTRMPLFESEAHIKDFIGINNDWVIEGCYSDLLQIVMAYADEVIFLNLPVENCIENAKNRSWEPHKYESQQAQDGNLNMLLQWISQYPEREDNFSQQAHTALFHAFKGKKQMNIINN